MPTGFAGRETSHNSGPLCAFLMYSKSCEEKKIQHVVTSSRYDNRMNLDDIDKEIASLKAQHASIEESSISEGIKTEILSVVEQASENLQNIRPIYENIDQINSFIVDPTKQVW